MDIHGAPNEIPDAKPFAQDTASRPYDRKAVERCRRALVQIDRVFAHFRTGYLGKVSPVYLFWGSFDLAVTRFSGRKAPLHPGGIPALPDSITQEAYSHESSTGFWPGGGGVDEARGGADQRRSSGGSYELLQSTYEAAADLAEWDRQSLECNLGIPRIPTVMRKRITVHRRSPKVGVESNLRLVIFPVSSLNTSEPIQTQRWARIKQCAETRSTDCVVGSQFEPYIAHHSVRRDRTRWHIRQLVAQIAGFRSVESLVRVSGLKYRQRALSLYIEKSRLAERQRPVR